MARLGDSVARFPNKKYVCAVVVKGLLGLFFVDREMRCNLRFGNLFVNEV